MFHYKIVVCLSICVATFGCSNEVAQDPQYNGITAPVQAPQSFEEYWYTGKAEITTYTLSQARYGELRQGNAVTVFVTEPFSMDKHVKSDDANAASVEQVLKLNSLRRFTTGIYDYSVMSSIFHPVDEEHAVKVTTSVQDWCGHIWAQLDLFDDEISIDSHSYFESEGELQQKVPAANLEDEIWTQIRLDPSKLPTGEVSMIPGTVFSRLLHKPLSAEKATATLEADGEGQSVYTITYPAFQRTLTIHFNKSFPHEIQAWEDEYVSGWGDKAKKLKTTAVLNKRIQSDYWNKNSLDDLEMRKILGL